MKRFNSPVITPEGDVLNLRQMLISSPYRKLYQFCATARQRFDCSFKDPECLHILPTQDTEGATEEASTATEATVACQAFFNFLKALRTVCTGPSTVHSADSRPGQALGKYPRDSTCKIL